MSVNVAELNDTVATSIYTDARLQAEAFLRQRTVTRLATALVQEVRADCPPSPPSTEQQARALLKSLGDQLTEASQALFMAAERMKQKGDGVGASQTYTAAMRTKAAAQGTR